MNARQRDPVAPYRSATPVSVRVDLAWEKGFRAGHDDMLRRFGLVAVVAVFGFLTRKRVHPFVIGFVTMVFTMVVVPAAVAIFVACRAGQAIRKWKSEDDTLVPGKRVTLDDGTVF